MFADMAANKEPDVGVSCKRFKMAFMLKVLVAVWRVMSIGDSLSVVSVFAGGRGLRTALVLVCWRRTAEIGGKTRRTNVLPPIRTRRNLVVWTGLTTHRTHTTVDK